MPPAKPGLGSPSGYDAQWAEGILLVGFVVVAAVILAILLAGQLSAVVFGEGWPTYPASEIPGILWRFATNPVDPAAAWSPAGAAVPGPVAWWSTFAVLVGVPGMTTGLAYGARTRGGAGRWARSTDLRRLRLRRDGPRLALGKSGIRTLTVESRHSLLVFGPTQSGKTTGLAIPAILEWPGPVVATSTKGDLVNDTIGWRSRLGRVHIFDPANATAFARSCWSPLASCTTWEGANRTAWELAMAGRASVGANMALGEFWFSSAAKALAPYLFAANRSGRRVDDVARWIDHEERDRVLGLLRRLHPDAALAHQATFRREDRARSSLFQVMQQVLGAYLDPKVAASAERDEIVATELLDGGSHTLYITAPHHDQERFRPLFATLIGQVLTAVYERTAASGGPLSTPMLLVLDEAANIAPVDDLPTIASTAAALGLQVVTVFQDLAQVKARYSSAAGTIVNNHRAKLVLPGVSDLETLDLVSRLAGDEEVDRDSVTMDLNGRRSTTRATHWRRLLAPELARQFGDGHGVLLYGNLPPVRLRLRPWYRSRRLRHRANLPHPQPAVITEDAQQTSIRRRPHPEPTPSGSLSVPNARPAALPNATSDTVREAALARLRQVATPSTGGDT